MESFTVCLNAVLPIFLLMAVGYAARCFHLLDRADVAKINKIIFRAFMPAMVFYNIYSSDLSSAVRGSLLGYAVLGVLAEFLLSLGYALLFVKERSRRGVVIQGLFRSNFVIIGLPIAESLVGGDLGPVAILLAAVVPVFNILSVISLAIFNGQKPDWKKVAADILENPLIIGSAVGIAALLAGIRLPAPLETVVSQMSAASSPMLLFLLGAFFRFGGMGGHLRELAAVCLGRLVVFPALFLGLAAVMGFRGVELVSLLGVFASSTAIASFTMAQQMGGDAELAGDIVVWTSALCSFTLFGWSLLFKLLALI